MRNKRSEMLSVDQRNNTLFASRLRIALEAANLSRAKIAKKVGITPQMVSHYCIGNNVPQLPVLAAIARELKVSTDYLLGLTENESAQPEIRSIGEYTGLDTNSIETLHKYRSVPLFMDSVNFLLSDLSLLESIADYLTTPLLDAVNRPPYNHVNLAQPIYDKLSSLRSIDLHDCAVSAQKGFAAKNAENSKLQEYVADRYVAKYSTGSSSCCIPRQEHTYSAHEFLYTLYESSSRTEYEDFIQSLEFFGISNINYVNAIKDAEKKKTTDSVSTKSE